MFKRHQSHVKAINCFAPHTIVNLSLSIRMTEYSKCLLSEHQTSDEIKIVPNHNITHEVSHYFPQMRNLDEQNQLCHNLRHATFLYASTH